MDAFRQQLRARMEKLDISPTELARLSGITRAYIYRVLDGSQVPSLELADKLAEAVGLAITTVPVKKS